MDPELKSILRGLSLSLRHLLEGYFDGEDRWHPGDLERRLNEIGIWRDRDPKPIDELPHLSKEDLNARKVVDAYLQYRKEAGVSLEEAVEEFVRESAYTWANRLFALRCMEARNLIDEVILQKEVYGWRSLQHNRLALKHPELCTGADDGLFLVLFQEFMRRAEELPQLFDPSAPAVALRPSVTALKKSVALLSGREPINGQDFASDKLFEEPDAFGWMYQYWNSEEKDRVFEKLRTENAKIEGNSIIPATQLYTEPYMVKFLVQNSLGAYWICMHPRSSLVNGWKYYAKDVARVQVKKKAVSKITFLDPACGSGHFLLEAFNLFYAMYKEEGILNAPEDICASILNKNLFGIEIDQRAVQIASAVLWMKAKEKASGLETKKLYEFHNHILATNIHLPKGRNHLESFLRKHPEDRSLHTALEVILNGFENAHEFGSLLPIVEPVENELKVLRKKLGSQATLFGPKTDEDWEEWKKNVLVQLKEHFKAEATLSDFRQAFFFNTISNELSLFDVLDRRYDIVATNPPFLSYRNTSHKISLFMRSNYLAGASDLFACFLLMAARKTKKSGYGALVVQQTLFLLPSFERLRTLLLSKYSITLVAHLGPRAFSDIGGEKVNVALLIFQNKEVGDSASIWVRSVDESNKPRSLLQAKLKNNQVFMRKNLWFNDLPGHQFLYWLPEEVISFLVNQTRLEEFAPPYIGIRTGDNARFTRMWWENNLSRRWKAFMMGAPKRSFYSAPTHILDWREGAQASMQRIRSRKLHFRRAIAFSRLGRRFCAVELPDWALFDQNSSGCFPEDPEYIPLILAYLNSRLARCIMTSLNPSIAFLIVDIARLPIPNRTSLKNNVLLEKLSRSCLDLCKTMDSKMINSRNWIRNSFFEEPGAVTLSDAIMRSVEDGLISQLFRTILIHLLNQEIFKILGIPDIQKRKISIWVNSISNPDPNSYPAIEGYNSLPSCAKSFVEIPIELRTCVKNQEFKILSNDELMDLKRRLRILYEVGSENNFKEKEIDANNEGTKLATQVYIPNETLLEDLASKLKIHPKSVYWLVKEGREKDGWHRLMEERRFVEDLLTVTVLRLLGHLWPKEIEEEKPVPEWCDKDGIIPFTEILNEKKLIERVREGIKKEFSGGSITFIEREFEQIMEISLEEWLAKQFFKHHIWQFKKRPIVWQIQSSPISIRGRKNITKKKLPAFSCLIYYHKLDDDLLHKIRNQYVRPLCSRHETELRTLENIQAATSDQTERRLTLENLIEELKDFDARLKGVITNGFDSTSLRKIVTEEPLDKWASIDGEAPPPSTRDLFYIQEKAYNPDLNDGVRVNIAPLQKAGLLATEVLSKKDVDRAIKDRAEWRGDERRWCREGKLPQPGWWKTKGENT